MLAAIRSAFTLIEMLVVIAIVAILASLLMPSLQGALEAARGVDCQNSFKMIGYAIYRFADDNQGRIPGGGQYLLGVNGSVAWFDILNKTALKDQSQIKNLGKPNPGKHLCCSNSWYLSGYYRHLNMNDQLTGSTYGISIQNEADWPSVAYGGNPSACYKLGALITGSRNPQQLIMLGDVDPSGGSSFNNNSGFGPYETSAVLLESNFEYFKFGRFSARHMNGTKISLLYLDCHTNLVDPERENFSSKNMLYRP